MTDEEALETIAPAPLSHMLSLSVGVNNIDNPGDWQAVYQTLCEISVELGMVYPYVSVSSAQTVPEETEEPEGPQLYADEETMHKVMHELLNAGLDGDAATHAISRMQNLGIVFQERL